LGNIVEENAMAGGADRPYEGPLEGIETELTLADTASFKALRDRTGFDPYNSMERVHAKQAWTRDPWKALPR
jgi:hypothetical protein